MPLKGSLDQAVHCELVPRPCGSSTQAQQRAKLAWGGSGPRQTLEGREVPHQNAAGMRPADAAGLERAKDPADGLG